MAIVGGQAARATDDDVNMTFNPLAARMQAVDSEIQQVQRSSGEGGTDTESAVRHRRRCLRAGAHQGTC